MAGLELNLMLVLYFQSQCLTESLGFLNPPLLQAAKRSRSRKNHLLNQKLRDNFLFLYVNSYIMNTKLTLNLDKDIIDEAKTYAKSHKVSLSKLVENYLNSLMRDSKKKSSVSPLVESLTGIIPSDYDEKNDYRNYIDKKYS